MKLLKEHHQNMIDARAAQYARYEVLDVRPILLFLLRSLLNLLFFAMCVDGVVRAIRTGRSRRRGN
jgi:hypothetical protein